MTYRFWHIGINCTDLDRTIEFYEKFGFKLEDRGQVVNPAVGRAFMVEGGSRVEHAHMRLPNGNDAEAMLDLIQWVEPATTGYAKPPSMIDPGLCRFSILCDDVDETRTPGPLSADEDRQGPRDRQGPSPADPDSGPPGSL